MKKLLLLICIFLFQTVIACSKPAPLPTIPDPDQVKAKSLTDGENLQYELNSHGGGYISKSLEESILNRYKNRIPKEWSEKADGVKTKLRTKDKVVALTFDACGGLHGSGYDRALIKYLVKENVPATLFINSRWIDSNKETFMELSRNSLFEIENHGYVHRPLSVNGRSAYGIAGTKDIKEVIEEVMLNEKKISELTGRKPRFFRSGTAFYDEIAVSILKDLGLEAAGFNILGDAGATFSKEQIRRSCLQAVPGSIIICHMNHPEKETSEGIKEVVPELRKRGYRFVKLEEYKLE